MNNSLLSKNSFVKIQCRCKIVPSRNHTLIYCLPCNVEMLSNASDNRIISTIKNVREHISAKAGSGACSELTPKYFEVTTPLLLSKVLQTMYIIF